MPHPPTHLCQLGTGSLWFKTGQPIQSHYEPYSLWLAKDEKP